MTKKYEESSHSAGSVREQHRNGNLDAVEEGSHDASVLKAPLLADVQLRHEREMERLHIEYLDRVRVAELRRLDAEEQLEELQRAHAELIEDHRLSQSLEDHSQEELETKSDLLGQAGSEFNTWQTRLDARQREVEQLRDRLIRSEHRESISKQRGFMTNHRAALRVDRILTGATQTLAAISVQTQDLRAALKRATNEREELLRANEDLKQTLHKVRGSKAYRLGLALGQAATKWDGLLRLPAQLLALFKRQEVIGVRKSNERKSERRTTSTSPVVTVRRLRVFLRKQGLEGAEARVARADAVEFDPQTSARRYVDLARMVRFSHPDAAARLAWRGVELDPVMERFKDASFLMYDLGRLSEARLLWDRLSDGDIAGLDDLAQRRGAMIVGAYRLLRDSMHVPDKRDQIAYEPRDGRVMYVAASSLPYISSGYTQRTHELVAQLMAQGSDVVCVTRPGFPLDRPDRLQPKNNSSVRVGSVTYNALPGPDRRLVPSARYISESADVIERFALDAKPALIQAASNYENALPALIAARRIGVPFVYEVRGLWEYTRASKIPGWEDSEAFELQKQLESLVASNADAVLALNQPLVDEMVLRGASVARAWVLPHAVDAKSFQRERRDAELAHSLRLDNDQFVVGYAGSITEYEGLQDLLTAVAGLRSQVDQAIKILVVGAGSGAGSIEQLSEDLGLGDALIRIDRVPHELIPDYLKLMDVVALPRRSYAVTELVTPLKPFEAMAAGVPLIVSDVAPLKSIVKDGESGLVHQAGSTEQLQGCLERLVRESGLGSRLASVAAQTIDAEYSWLAVLTVLDECYRELGFKREYVDTDSAPGVGPKYLRAPIPIPLIGNSFSVTEREAWRRLCLEALDRGGTMDLESLIEAQTAGHSSRFSAWCELAAAKACLPRGETDEAIRLIERAVLNDSSSSTLRGAAQLYLEAGLLEEGVSMVAKLREVQPELTESDDRLIRAVMGRHELAVWAAESGAESKWKGVEGRILNILAFSVPYSSVGYSTRSHGLAMAIKKAGWDIRPYTRPGFPVDQDELVRPEEVPEYNEVEGLRYGRILGIDRTSLGEVEYLHESIATYETIIRRERPALVHAASNYVIALPAMIAARRLSVPFVYEVRGFWEVTRVSRAPDFAWTAKYRYMKLFESLVYRNADYLITINASMRDELIQRGADADRISVAYNGFAPEKFDEIPRDYFLAEELGIPDAVPVIGYVGSFVDYEGLDDLVRACAELFDSGQDLRLLLVGDGPCFDAIRDLVIGLSLQDVTVLTGRVPHDRVNAYYSLIDVAPFPRKPWPVCELVSPIKPLEAMAAGKVVIGPRVKVFAEIIDDGNTGFTFKAGDSDDLREVIHAAIRDWEHSVTVARAGREWVRRNRSWDAIGHGVAAVYRTVLEGARP